MAYPMSRARPGTETVVLPASPVVWAGYAHRTARACTLVVILWALAVAMLGFFSPLEMGRVFDDVAHFVPALLFVIGVVGALSLGAEIGKAFKHVLGYGMLRRVSEHHGHTVVPRRGRRLAIASVLVGWLLGCIVAALIRALAGHWLGFFLVAGLAVLLLVPAGKSVKLATIMWRKAREEQRIHRDIVASGEHSVGVVVAVTNEEFVVDGRALFHVDLEYQTGGRTEVARVRFAEHPVWSPAIGNEFDVWFDPERPFVEDRIMIERRYVGQEFVSLEDEPSPGEHVSDQDIASRLADAVDGLDTGRETAGLRPGPQWLVDEFHPDGPATPKAARRTRVLIGIPPNLIAVLALAGTIMVPFMVADVPWWTHAALWAYTVLTLLNAAVYWQFMLRRRWFIRSGISFGATEAAVFAGFFAAGFAMLTTHNLVFAPLFQEIEWTPAHVLTWAAVVGALLVFEWAFTSNAWALRHLNAEFPAPPEVIQEALTGHDPEGVDKLERDYGYRAGVFLCD